jgi:hypothetical protein
VETVESSSDPPQCTRWDSNPQALRRRNLKADGAPAPSQSAAIPGGEGEPPPRPETPRDPPAQRWAQREAAPHRAEDGPDERAEATPADPSPVASGAPSPAPGETSTANPRAKLLAFLAASVAELAAAGDLDGARVAAAALSALLGPAGEGAPVVDLATARRERGGR